MFKPRNTLVLVKLYLKPEERVGDIVVPTGEDEYCEGEVLEVGPGNILSSGAVSETIDLQKGQRVLVKHRRKSYRQSAVSGQAQAYYSPEGIPVKRTGDIKDDHLFLFEQTNILAIVG